MTVSEERESTERIHNSVVRAFLMSWAIGLPVLNNTCVKTAIT